MTGSGFTRLGGLGAVLGGVLWVASFGAAQAISPTLKWFLVGPVLLLLLGFAALQARHATGSGAIGKAGFGLSLLGLILLAYGSVGHATISGDIGGTAYGPFYFAGLAPGAMVLGAGAVLTAISMIIANVLPRLSPIPLLVGSVGVAVAGGIAVGRQFAEGVGTVRAWLAVAGLPAVVGADAGGRTGPRRASGGRTGVARELAAAVAAVAPGRPPGSAELVIYPRGE